MSKFKTYARSNINMYEILGKNVIVESAFNAAIFMNPVITKTRPVGISVRKNEVIKRYMKLLTLNDWRSGRLSEDSRQTIRRDFLYGQRGTCEKVKVPYAIWPIIRDYGSQKLQARFKSRKQSQEVKIEADVKKIRSVATAVLSPSISKLPNIPDFGHCYVIYIGDSLGKAKAFMVLMRMVPNSRFCKMDQYFVLPGRGMIYSFWSSDFYYPLIVNGSVRQRKRMFEEALFLINDSRSYLVMDNKMKHSMRCHMSFLPFTIPMASTICKPTEDFHDLELDDVDCSSGGVLSMFRDDSGMYYGIKDGHLSFARLKPGEITNTEPYDAPQLT